MNRTIYHLIKEGQNFYYGSLKAIYVHNSVETLGVTLRTLYKKDFDREPYENKLIRIQKGELLTTKPNDTKRNKKPAARSKAHIPKQRNTAGAAK